MNLYDIKQCRDAISVIGAINTTVRIKSQHSLVVWEIRSALEKLEPINKYLFDPEYNEGFHAYNQAVTVYYNSTTKSRLDSLLKLVLRKNIRTLKECIELEEETLDGRLVENPAWTEGSPKLRWIEPSEIK